MKLSLKFRLFLPIAIIIIIIVAVATYLFINKSIKTIDKVIENNLDSQVEIIYNMFEREKAVKIKNVEDKLKIAYKIFDNYKFEVDNSLKEITAINQDSKFIHTTLIKKFKINDEDISNNVFVDSLQKILGGTITIFQKIDSGYIRVSTNVLNNNNERAINTFIPLNSPVTISLLADKIFLGRAYVVNDWYITSYMPLLKNEQQVGALYYGEKEKDINELKKILSGVKIGKTGFPFVFDKQGNLLIHPENEGQCWRDSMIFKKFEEIKSGIVKYKIDNRSKVASVKYFEDFEIYIAASIIEDEESKAFIKETILAASIIFIIVILLLLAFVYYITSERIKKVAQKIEISNKKLTKAQIELRQSEDRFKKLFDSTGDDIFVTDSEENIVEVNQATCNTLGYSRQELLSKKMHEIKTPKFAPMVSYNRKKIYELGAFTFESEHVTKEGKVLPVELTSKVVEYNNEKLILSISRNIEERKEIERQILSAVIKTEERERERFAKDMHDGLGPLLSTIKLYVNELKSNTLVEDEREQFVKYSNELIDEAVSSTRTISNNLMPTIIHNYGLVKALESFFEKINKTNQIKIKFETDNISERLDKNLELIFFRVISELINNTLKHARANNVLIMLLRNENKLSLYFKDDGIGFKVDEIMNTENKGIGLKNIISRIKSINGYYKFNSSEGEGFSIKIEIDL